MFRPFTSAARRGLTLIELVVVLAIIAILAVMVIPRLDFLKAQAEHASSAGTQADLGAMIQTFKTSSGKYPSFDLLVDTSGALLSTLQPQTAGTALQAETIDPPGAPGSDWYRSFYDAGFVYGYQHSTSATDASASGTQTVEIVDGVTDGSSKFAVLKATGGGSAATAIRNALYPGGATWTPAAAGTDGTLGTTDDVPGFWSNTNVGTVPSTSKLVVFGIGPKSNLIGNVVATAPSSAMGADDSTTTYCRYFVVFEIFSSGAPAKFRMITDHRLRQINARVDLYKQGSAIN